MIAGNGSCVAEVAKGVAWKNVGGMEATIERCWDAQCVSRSSHVKDVSAEGRRRREYGWRYTPQRRWNE